MFAFIPRSLCALKKVASSAEHSRFGATTAIKLELQPGVIRAEATDGRRALIVQCPRSESEADLPWAAMKEVPDEAITAFVPPDLLEKGAKVGEKFFRDRANGMMGLATVGNNVLVGIGADLVSGGLVEGRFPDVQQAIPKQKPMFTFRIDPKLMIKTLSAIEDLLDGSESVGVDLFFYGQGLPIGLMAKNHSNGMMIDGVIVPLVGGKAEEEDAVQKEKERADKKAEKPVNGTPVPAEGTKAPEGETKPPKKGKKGQKVETPIMEQYRLAKERHPGMILLFRIGDFFEMFDEDARIGAKVLGLTLTTRDKTTDMAGFPHHQLEAYLAKLLKEGHRVAVCEPVADNEAVAGKVDRVVTPEEPAALPVPERLVAAAQGE